MDGCDLAVDMRQQDKYGKISKESKENKDSPAQFHGNAYVNKLVANSYNFISFVQICSCPSDGYV